MLCCLSFVFVCLFVCVHVHYVSPAAIITATLLLSLFLPLFIFLFLSLLSSYHSSPPSLSLLSRSLCSFLCPSLSHPHPDHWSSMRADFKYLKEYLGWLYYQYLLITGIYVLEPWEQSIFNSVLFSSMAMVIYTSYVFVPVHVCLALKFFCGICGEQPESTMALIN